jgi:hypothetical protein
MEYEAVENEAYCMPSMQKRNVDQMNMAMGYYNMEDRANTPKYPTGMKTAKTNPQMGPVMSKNPGRQGY